jgi:glycosyltransferase involved in cell wall biosynthesis
MEIVTGIPYVNFHIYGRVVDGYRNTFFSGLEKFRLISSNRINYLGTIPYVELPAILMQYDIGVCFYDKSVINTVYASPAKIFEYMKAGLIIFSTDQPTPQKIIDTLNGGYIYHDDRLNESVTVLQDLYNDQQKVIELRKANLKSFWVEFNYTKQARELFDWINSL